MKARISRALERVRALPPARRDASLAALVLAVGLVEIALAELSGGERAGAFALVALIVAGTALRTAAPVTGALLATTSFVVLAQLSDDAADQVAWIMFAVLFAIFSMALHTDGRRLAGGLAAVLAIVFASSLVDSHDDTASDYVFVTVVFVGAPAVGGQLLRSRGRLNQALRERAQRAERDRDRRAQEAVAGERERIVGELHDVVAHALGAMTVQAGAARRLAAADPVRGREAFLAVETTGREALAELRRLLGVLRREDEELALAPQPQLVHLSDLVRRTVAGGLPVELVVEGEPPAEVPVGVDVTGYRVVQEALAEARDHGAAGRARVRVRYRPAEVLVEVTDDGAVQQPRRLLGMAERVRVYGGDLEAGVRPGTGHVVRARLPLGASG